jgi:hypothetical protein
MCASLRRFRMLAERSVSPIIYKEGWQSVVSLADHFRATGEYSLSSRTLRASALNHLHHGWWRSTPLQLGVDANGQASTFSPSSCRKRFTDHKTSLWRVAWQEALLAAERYCKLLLIPRYKLWSQFKSVLGP